MPRLFPAGLNLRISGQWVSRLSTRLVLLILAAIAMGLLVGFVEMTWARHRISREVAAQRASNEETQRHVAALQGEAEFRESDVFAEQAAREQLGMARDGETVIMPTVLLPEPSAPAASPAARPSAPAAAAAGDDELPPNYERWWQAFFPAP